MAASTAQKLVFLVEDDKFYLELLENYFTSKRIYRISRFMSGEECVQNLKQKPDLIILDYVLDNHNPNSMDGRNVYQKIKQECPSAKVIVLSGQQSADVVFTMVKEGMRNYIMKDKETFHELDQLLEEYA